MELCFSPLFVLSRYRRIESDEDDDECMESSFAQQMKEERISTKIGNTYSE